MVEFVLPVTHRAPERNGLSIGALPIQESEIESSARALVEAWSTKNQTYNYYSGSDALFEALRVIRGADRESATVSIIEAFLRVENSTGQRLAESLTFASRLLEIVESCRPAPEYAPIIPAMWPLAEPTERLRGLVASKACSATAQASGDILGLPWEDLRAFFSQTVGLSAAAAKQWEEAQRAYAKALEQREIATLADLKAGHPVQWNLRLSQVSGSFLNAVMDAIVTTRNHKELLSALMAWSDLWGTAGDSARSAVRRLSNSFITLSTRAVGELQSLWPQLKTPPFQKLLSSLSDLEVRSEHPARFFTSLALLCKDPDTQQRVLDSLKADSRELVLRSAYQTAASLLRKHQLKVLSGPLLAFRPAIDDRQADAKFRADYRDLLLAYFADSQTDPRTFSPTFRPIAELTRAKTVNGTTLQHGSESSELSANQVANLLFAAACEHNTAALLSLGEKEPSTGAKGRLPEKYTALLEQLWNRFDLSAVKCVETALGIQSRNATSGAVLARLTNELAQASDPRQKTRLDAQIATITHYRKHGLTIESISTAVGFNPNAAAQMLLVADLTEGLTTKRVYRFAPAQTSAQQLENELRVELTLRGFAPRFAATGLRAGPPLHYVVENRGSAVPIDLNNLSARPLYARAQSDQVSPAFINDLRQAITASIRPTSQ